MYKEPNISNDTPIERALLAIEAVTTEHTQEPVVDLLQIAHLYEAWRGLSLAKALCNTEEPS